MGKYNFNSDITIHTMKTHSEEWFKFRWENGIGSSEMASLVGQNPYESPVYLYHRKIGTIPQPDFDNERMFWGRTLEDVIAWVWQYYDGKENWYENVPDEIFAVTDKIVRKCSKVNGYAVNSAYPYLFDSTDRLINKKGGFNLLNGEILQVPAPLEIKNISEFSKLHQKDKIPDYYVCQLHHHMIVYNSPYGEYVVNIGSGKLEVVPIEFDDELAYYLITESEKFWKERVLPGREAVRLRNEFIAQNNVTLAEEQQAIIDSLEPEANGSECDTKYFNSVHEVETQTILADEIETDKNLFQLAKDYVLYNEAGKELNSKKTKIGNMFRQLLSHEKAQVLSFAEGGKDKISYKDKFTVSIKSYIPTKEEIENCFKI